MSGEIPIDNTDESGDGDLTAIDREWAELNYELDNPSEPRIEQIVEQERFSAIVNEVFVRYSDYDQQRVLDYDHDKDGQLRREFLDTIRKEKFDELESQRNWSDTSSSIHDDIKILTECLIEYDERHDFEALLIRDTALIALSERFPNDAMVTPYLASAAKKHLQATLLVAHGYKPDHALQCFIEEMTPGTTGLSFYNYVDENLKEQVAVAHQDDKHYIISAKDNHWQQKDILAKKRWLIREAQLKMAVSEYEEDLEQALEIAGILMKMYTVSTRASYTDTAKANKVTSLWEVARELGRPDSELSPIVELFFAEGSPSN